MVFQVAVGLATAYLASEASYLEKLFEELEEEPRYSVSGPLASIIVPTHNEEKYLPNLLKSLEKQTYRSFEVIIVDWKSSDRTKEIARKWGETTGIAVEIVDTERKGVGYASYLGEEKARGEIIVRTDADTKWSPYTLEIAVKTLLQNPELKLYWTAFTWYDADPVTTLFTWIARHFRDPCKPHGRFQAVKREVKKVRHIFNRDLDVGEDIEVGIWICREFGKKAVYYDKDRAIFTSARRLYAVGVAPYLAGEDLKRGFPPRR